MQEQIKLGSRFFAHSAVAIVALIASGSVCGQTVISYSSSVSSSSITNSVSNEPPVLPLTPAFIIARFTAAERNLRDELNQHTFRRDVVLQTIGPQGQVTGEYIRNSEFIFDDQGNRIERVLFRPKSTLKYLRITKEDIQDLAGAQLLGIDVAESQNYDLSFAGTEVVDSRELFAIDVSPREKPDPRRMRNRYFIGRVWIDPITFQLAKVRGVTEPQGKQRFPVFETWRESTGAELPFPVRTKADEVLRFPNRDVHYRIHVRYFDYKRFASRVKITEVDER